MVKKISFFIFIGVFNFQSILGQFVVGASRIDNAAQFEVVSTNKGVLLPRVQLTGTNDVTTVYNVSIGSKESLLVYNTATANDVIPGYYYWDKNKWIPLIGTDNQHLTLSGNNLSIVGGNSVSLSSLDTDNQTLSLSGTNLAIQGGNTISLNGLLDNLGNHTATTTLQMSKQKIANVGYIEFAAGNGAREGYIGNNNDIMQYVAEQGGHSFSAGSGDNSLPAGSPVVKMTGDDNKKGGVLELSNNNSYWGANLIIENRFKNSNGKDISFNVGGEDIGYFSARNGGDGFTGLLYSSTKGNHNFTGGSLRVSNLPEVSESTYATVTENDGTLRKQSWQSIKEWIVGEVPSLADNLGNHNATTRLWMNGNEIQGAGSNTLINGVEVGQVGLGGSWLGLANKNQATTSGYALIQNNAGQTLLNTQSGQKIGFRVADAEKMTMTSNGNFGIGISPSFKLHVSDRMKMDGVFAGTWIEAGTNDWFLGRNRADLRIHNNGDRVTFKPNGDVGIGTSNPASKLTVKDGNFRAISNQPNLFLDRNGAAVWRVFVSSGDSGIDANDFVIRKEGAGPAFVINDQTGNVGFGVARTGNHKIKANGSIKATRFVSNNRNYPDYVFDHYYDGSSELNEKYTFLSLEEVEEYTRQNGHLPGVSSIRDIKREGGIDISRLGVQNLEKIEELYLHIIELNKTINSLKEENEELSNKLNSEMTQMNDRIDQLSKLVKKSSK